MYSFAWGGLGIFLLVAEIFIPGFVLFFFGVGAIILSFLVFEPRGLARMWERFKAFYRLWPFSY